MGWSGTRWTVHLDPRPDSSLWKVPSSLDSATTISSTSALGLKHSHLSRWQIVDGLGYLHSVFLFNQSGSFYSTNIGLSIRPICTRCCFTMTNMIQACSNFLFKTIAWNTFTPLVRRSWTGWGTSTRSPSATGFEPLHTYLTQCIVHQIETVNPPTKPST